MLLVLLAVCLVQTEANPLFTKHMEIKLVPVTVLCADEVTRCPDDQLCCRLEGGSMGCCDKTINTVPLRKQPAVLKNFNATVNSICPDPTYSCPETETCCPADSVSGWACCPSANAECCIDRIHCCPFGYFCSGLECVAEIVKKLQEIETTALMIDPAVGMTFNSTVNAICPDPAFTCPETDTCCPSSTDTGWGCCPTPDAECCLDRLRCCPNGYFCSGTECVAGIAKKDIETTALMIDPAVRNTFNSTVNAECPDPAFTCPGTDTCCPSSTDTGWGCCPTPDAVCCIDRLHCCPTGFVCSGLDCVTFQDIETTALMIDPAVRKTFNSTVNAECPDPAFTCPGTDTCCPSSTDTGWGCCPTPDAVCCIDRLHCCPNGFVCSGLDCVTFQDIETTALMIDPAVRKTFNSTVNAECPDPAFTCPGTDTCCPSSTDTGWGCCPTPDAVCCIDRLHCCPNGFVCSGLDCVTFQKIETAALMIDPSVRKTFDSTVNAICPDPTFSCPGTDTCCPSSTDTGWGCCPSPDAVCCIDRLHCCPNGSVCSGLDCITENVKDV